MDLDALLDSVLPESTSRRCSVCQNETLSAAIRRWLERKAAGEHLPTLSHMHEKLFIPKLGATGKTTVREHIVFCLKLDHTTGKPL